jgi:hypothetical protein
MTEAVAPTQAPVVERLKKPRSELQKQSLEAARAKALALRAERKAQKPQKPPAAEATEPAAEPAAEPEVEPAAEAQEEVEYVRRARSKPKKPKKRVIIVEESSSEEEELEIRLPKRRPVAPEQSARDARLERLGQKMFSL